ncbi:plastoglobulin-1, chloroplastic [Gastrolobium bilobum]|uniref:plastoglobulin-1, chloroplastic n=1 Tax=Gastrolobium bilobum TaxID=150636 RepID=UPI002AB06989|nr:plastoglobulin-1, chloroplastic [Gastrolobium bilobum]
MAVLSFTSRTPFVFSLNHKPHSLSSPHFQISLSPRCPRFPSLRFNSSSSASAAGDTGDADKASSKISDEWGEDYEPEPEASSKLPDSDPPKDEDEWQGGVEADAGGYIDGGNGTPATSTSTPAEERVDDKLEALKRALVDTAYGTELGFRAGSEIRAEMSELVTQLEAANPTLAPVEEPGLLNGNWVLLYTASSELLPLLAVGTLPLLKVDKISQTIDTSSFTIINSTTLSSPFASWSFSASASFEVRSPTRIQVIFKEGTVQPIEIKSNVELPENVDIFGQKLSLLPLQQSLGPVQNVVASISRVISGQPPLKIPIPGERTSSWLLTTYLDKDLRISRGDGGLFVLAREGSPLLDQ